MSRDYSNRRYKCAVCGKIIPAEGRRVMKMVKPPLTEPHRYVVCGECFSRLNQRGTHQE